MKRFSVASFVLLLAGVPFILTSYATDIQTAAHDIRRAEGSRFALEVFKSKLWEGRKHTFVFDRYSGALSFDREQPERSAIRFVVETGSVRCVDDWVKPNQIKDIENAAKNLMAAESYKQMMFQSTAITVKSSEQ